jgi:Fic family protein
MQMIQSLQQRAGQRAQAGADLDHIVGGFRANRADDIGDDPLIDKEVLAKLFFGFMHDTLARCAPSAPRP